MPTPRIVSPVTQIRAICAGRVLLLAPSPPPPRHPPAHYCTTQRRSVLWFAWLGHVTSLKMPPPFSSLFISSKLFERRGVTQSKTSFSITAASLKNLSTWTPGCVLCSRMGMCLYQCPVFLFFFWVRGSGCVGTAGFLCMRARGGGLSGVNEMNFNRL